MSLKKLKIFSGEISWCFNTRNDWAVKWLCLISIKPEQVSKICSIVKSSSQLMHIGPSSTFSRKEWVIKDWPMRSRAITVSSFLFVREQTTHCFKTGNISCNLFPGSSSHSDWHNLYIYLLARDFKSENGMSSTKVSPTRASLAAVSAAELPLMPTCPGTQTKTVSFPSLFKSIYSSRIWTWCSYFRLNIAFNDESESDSIKNDFLLEQLIRFRAKRIACSSALELSSGRRHVKGFLGYFVETAAAATPASVKTNSDEEYSEVSCK